MDTPLSFPKKCPRSFPFEAGRRNAVLTMYRTNTEGHSGYRFAWTKDGKRKFASFSNYPKAANFGNELLFQLSRNEGDDLVLKSDEKSAYCRAVDMLRPLGVNFESAITSFVEASKLLEGTQTSVIEAARSHAKRFPAKLPDKTVADVVAEFIATKEQGNKSRPYIADLRHRLGRFKDAFQVNVSRIDRSQFQSFLDALKLSPRSYNNFRGALLSLFEFAKRRKYLPADWNEFDGVETVKDNGGAIEIFTPDELVRLLVQAREDLIPFLVIGGFAGLRSAEIDRLDWHDVKFDTGFIIVEKGKAKTASRRVVPMSENLKEWLGPYSKRRGRVWPHSHAYLYEALQATAAATAVEANAERGGDAMDAVKWKQNALRHSFISYRVAEIQDVNKVALEAGNSPAMIFSNYRELVTPNDAKKWFAIKPEVAANVLGLKAA